MRIMIKPALLHVAIGLNNLADLERLSAISGRRHDMAIEAGATKGKDGLDGVLCLSTIGAGPRHIVQSRSEAA